MMMISLLKCAIQNRENNSKTIKSPNYHCARKPCFSDEDYSLFLSNKSARICAFFKQNLVLHKLAQMV